MISWASSVEATRSRERATADRAASDPTIPSGNPVVSSCPVIGTVYVPHVGHWHLDTPIMVWSEAVRSNGAFITQCSQAGADARGMGCSWPVFDLSGGVISFSEHHPYPRKLT